MQLHLSPTTTNHHQPTINQLDGVGATAFKQKQYLPWMFVSHSTAVCLLSTGKHKPCSATAPLLLLH
jgi:hypothetical protein